MSTRAPLLSFARRTVAFVACAALLAACGGGSSTAPHVTQSTNSSSGPKGTATLTLHFPTNFHHAMTHGRTVGRAPAGATRGSTSTKRSPKYINPTSGDVLHVYVQPYNVSQFEVTPSGGVAITPNSSDNTQVFSVSVPAGQYESVSAVENDGNGDLLAEGTDYDTFTIEAGSSGNTFAVTMSMSPQYIVLTTDINAGADATVLSNDDDTAFCTYGTPHQTIYALAADGQAGYVLPGTAAGGPVDSEGNIAVPTPSLSQAPTSSDGSTLAASAFGGAFITTLVSPTYSTIYASFFVTSQYFGSYAYGYAALSGAGSYACLPVGSLSSYSVEYGDPPVTLQISGGTAPYSIADGNTCSFQQADAPLTDQWFINTDYSGTCDIVVTDHNGTASSPIALYVGGGP